MGRRYLTVDETRAYYDRFGIKQDWQRFYEGTALRELLRYGGFEHARAVFELGCGTGAFARELLGERLPRHARYLGVDVSATMIGIATPRLARFGTRARVRLSDGGLRFDEPDGSFDRFVANYVLDLLDPAQITQTLAEAGRLLTADGRLCAVSLSCGVGWLSRGLSRLWDRVHRRRPQLVGGCRPLRLLDCMAPDRWRVLHHHIVTAFGIPSEVLIARPLNTGEAAI